MTEPRKKDSTSEDNYILSAIESRTHINKTNMIEGFYFQKKTEHDSCRERTKRGKEINAKLRFLPKHGK